LKSTKVYFYVVHSKTPPMSTISNVQFEGVL